MEDPLVESKIAESANAAAVREEALLRAHSSVMQDSIVNALRQVLVEDEDNSPILVKSKIKRICDDVRDIKKDMSWHRYLLIGITAGIGMIALKTLSGV